MAASPLSSRIIGDPLVLGYTHPMEQPSIAPQQPEPSVPVITPTTTFATPSAKQQSWGALISIIIIVCMVVIGAFYAWGERIAEDRVITDPIGEALAE